MGRGGRADGGETDRSFRLPRAFVCSEPEEVGARAGEYWVPESTSWLEEEPDDWSDAGKDRFFISCGVLCGAWSAGFGNAAGEGGLTYGRGELAWG